MRAMVLAAGFGNRLRPITLERPKPLVRVGGRILLDRALDQLARGGVTQSIINVHYLGEQIIAYTKNLDHRVSVTISDERDAVLETGGGIVKALPLLGHEPFITINADTFWVEDVKSEPAVARMAARFDADLMDILLLVCSPDQAVGHSGGVDFNMDDTGHLVRSDDAPTGFVYAGVAIIHPRIFSGAKAIPHSLNRYFDAAIKNRRLFGLPLGNAAWYTVSTPDSLTVVEEHLRLNGDMAPLNHDDL